MVPSRIFRIAALVLVIAIYAAVRLWRLTDSCLWFDEIFSVHAAEQPWSNLFNFVALDLIHPPLFYLWLKIWVAVGGDGVFWLRLLPVIFSVAAIFPFLALCRELKLRDWTTALALFFLATNGSLIKYAQEVRMYSLLMCLSLFSMWMFVRWLNLRKGIVPLVLTNILLVYAHYFGWFVIGAEIAAVLVMRRHMWRGIAAAFVIVFAAFTPWLIALGLARNNGSSIDQNIGWMQRPGPRQIGTLVLDVIDPFYFQTNSAEPASLYPFSILILLLMAIAVVFRFWKPAGNRAEMRDSVKLLVILLTVPIVAVFLVSWISPYSIWGVRHLIIVISPAMMLISMAFTGLRSTALSAMAIGFFVLLSLPGFAHLWRNVPDNSWCSWSNASTSVDEQTPIFAAEDLIAYHIWFARRGTSGQVFKVEGLEGVVEDRAYFLPRGFGEVKPISVADVTAGRILFAFRGNLADEAKPPLRQFTANGYKVVKVRQYAASPDVANLVLLEK
jgi:uncharacterized membrane protein